MDLEKKIIFKGLDYSVSGKKEFIKKILSFPEIRDDYISLIMDSDIINKLDLRKKIVSFGNRFHSVSLNEEDLLKLFDLTTTDKLLRFLNDSNLSDVERDFYTAYLAPVLNPEYTQSFLVDYYLIYAIVNQDRCIPKLKELWHEHPEYYSYYLNNIDTNYIFESNLLAHLIPYSRMLYAMLEMMRTEKSEAVYNIFIDLINVGFPYIKKYLKRSKCINSDVLRDIVNVSLKRNSIPHLYSVCITPIALVLANHYNLPMFVDYDLIIMLDSVRHYTHEFENKELNEEQSDEQETPSTVKGDTKQYDDFLKRFRIDYGTVSSATELHMPLTSMDVTPAPQSDMVGILMLSNGISFRKLAHFTLDDSEIDDLLSLKPSWNKKDYWYALHISSLCKYISQLENNIIHLLENESPVEKYSYEEEKESLALEKKIMDKEKLFIQNSLHNLEEEVTLLNQEISRLRSENESLLKKHENESKDLTALRNYVYLLSANDTDSIAADTSYINYDNWSDRKVAVIGGHDNWQSKLKDEFPNWTYVRSENKNFPAAAIKDKDYIICNTEVLSHAAYYKLISVKGKGQKLLFVRSNNLDLVMKELALQLDAS